MYRLFVPKQAVGASLDYFDLFNNTNDKALIIKYVRPIVSGAVAVTGVLGVDLFLTHTSAVGTGGTAATRNGTSLTAATFTGESTNLQEVNPLITARLTPTGGATAAGVIAMSSVSPEETTSGTYVEKNFITSDVVVIVGSGIRVVQGAVASVGNIAFDVGFDVVDRV